MAEELNKHPLLVYLTFVMPIVLLAIGATVHAPILFIILAVAWLGVAFMILFLPIESEAESTNR